MRSQQVESQRGFTLIELMIVVMIAGVLLSIGISGFSDFIKTMRMESETQEFIQALKFARTEAVRSGLDITVASNDDSDANNEWGTGLTVSRGGEVIRRVDSFTVVIDSTLDLGSITYNGRGFTDAGAQEIFAICDDRSGETGRTVNLLTSGLLTADLKNDC